MTNLCLDGIMVTFVVCGILLIVLMVVKLFVDWNIEDRTYQMVNEGIDIPEDTMKQRLRELAEIKYPYSFGQFLSPGGGGAGISNLNNKARFVEDQLNLWKRNKVRTK